MKTTNRQPGSLMHSLLTDDNYWTFWRNDWGKRINVFWGGKTKFQEIKDKMENELGPNFRYERQVQPKEPDQTFD